jgi:hypothetical protein
MGSVRLGMVGVVALVSACSSEASHADLPAGWEGAALVQRFSQATCGGSADVPMAPAEAIDVTLRSSAVSVAYHNARFRCAQTVQAFARVHDASVDFLVQPVDMNPTRVAACDCLYEITLGEDVPADATNVVVYRRYDHSGGNPVDPTLVASAALNMP